MFNVLKETILNFLFDNSDFNFNEENYDSKYNDFEIDNLYQQVTFLIKPLNEFERISSQLKTKQHDQYVQQIQQYEILRNKVAELEINLKNTEIQYQQLIYEKRSIEQIMIQREDYLQSLSENINSLVNEIKESSELEGVTNQINEGISICSERISILQDEFNQIQKRIQEQQQMKDQKVETKMQLTKSLDEINSVLLPIQKKADENKLEITKKIRLIQHLSSFAREKVRKSTRRQTEHFQKQQTNQNHSFEELLHAALTNYSSLSSRITDRTEQDLCDNITQILDLEKNIHFLKNPQEVQKYPKKKKDYIYRMKSRTSAIVRMATEQEEEHSNKTAKQLKQIESVIEFTQNRDNHNDHKIQDPIGNKKQSDQPKRRFSKAVLNLRAIQKGFFDNGKLGRRYTQQIDLKEMQNNKILQSPSNSSINEETNQQTLKDELQQMHFDEGQFLMDEIKSQIQIDSDQEIEIIKIPQSSRYSSRQLQDWEVKIDFASFQSPTKQKREKTYQSNQFSDDVNFSIKETSNTDKQSSVKETNSWKKNNIFKMFSNMIYDCK